MIIFILSLSTTVLFLLCMRQSSEIAKLKGKSDAWYINWREAMDNIDSKDHIIRMAQIREKKLLDYVTQVESSKVPVTKNK